MSVLITNIGELVTNQPEAAALTVTGLWSRGRPVREVFMIVVAGAQLW